jgi:putative transposase
LFGSFSRTASFLPQKCSEEKQVKIAYKFRMYPTRQQEAMLDLTLETCRNLYNLALADRKNAYEVEGISRTYEDQAAMLTAERKNGNFNGIYAHCLRMF